MRCLRKVFTWCNHVVLKSKSNLERYASLRGPFHGFKQASRSRNLCFDGVVKSFDFIKNEDELSVYKKPSGSAITFMVLYVDEILLIRNDVGMPTLVKTWLSIAFCMKCLREVTYILSIHVYRNRAKGLLGLS